MELENTLAESARPIAGGLVIEADGLRLTPLPTGRPSPSWPICFKSRAPAGKEEYPLANGE